MDHAVVVSAINLLAKSTVNVDTCANTFTDTTACKLQLVCIYLHFLGLHGVTQDRLVYEFLERFIVHSGEKCGLHVGTISE